MRLPHSRRGGRPPPFRRRPDGQLAAVGRFGPADRLAVGFAEQEAVRTGVRASLVAGIASLLAVGVVEAIAIVLGFATLGKPLGLRPRGRS